MQIANGLNVEIYIDPMIYLIQKFFASSMLLWLSISFTTQLQVSFFLLKSSCLPAFVYSLFMASAHFPKIILSTHLLACAGTTEMEATAAKAITKVSRDIYKISYLYQKLYTTATDRYSWVIPSFFRRDESDFFPVANQMYDQSNVQSISQLNT